MEFLNELKMSWQYGRFLGVGDVLYHCGLLPKKFGRKICDKYENQFH